MAHKMKCQLLLHNQPEKEGIEYGLLFLVLQEFPCAAYAVYLFRTTIGNIRSNCKEKDLNHIPG